MAKNKMFNFLFLTLILILTFFYSCSKDDPVSPPPVDSTYIFDTARYSWDADTLFGNGYTEMLWARDSSEIYITNVFTNRLYNIKNHIRTFIQFPQEILLGGVFPGINNEGYLMALSKVGEIYQPYYAKFNGTSFLEIPNPQNLEKSYTFNAVYVNNDNDMWSGDNGIIVHFDGVKLTSYELEDSTTKVLKFFYDDQNKFKILASVLHSQISGGKIEYLIYEFDGTRWNKIYNNLETPRPLRYRIVGNEIGAGNSTMIFKLIDSMLIDRVTVIPNGFDFSFGGKNFDDLLIAANQVFPGECVASFFHWNGLRWSRELCGYYVSPDTEIIYYNENYFYAISYDFSDRTFILKGKKQQ